MDSCAGFISPKAEATIRIRGKVELADVDDARKLILGKFYWARYFFDPSVIGVLIAWTGCALYAWVIRDWFPVGDMSFVAAVLLSLHYFGDRPKKHVERLNTTLAEWITVLPSGFLFEEADGMTVFIPWIRYKNYQEGERMIWVKGLEKGSGIMLPVSDLLEIEKQALRSQLDQVLR